ncbi:MAG: hypothetical protein JW941_07880, partial [Candidatus Coatesbacteria bacterium]|nr:hypothetical protein [Candidatus Coatesbacteria bacterium]
GMADLPKASFVLANPHVMVETGRVYSGLGFGGEGGKSPTDENRSAVFVGAAEAAGKWGLMRNDLQSVARRLYPSIDEVFEAFAGLGVEYAMLSGSGASVFAPVASLEEGKELVVRLQTAGFWAACCRSVGRDEYRRFVGLTR